MSGPKKGDSSCYLPVKQGIEVPSHPAQMLRDCKNILVAAAAEIHHH